MRTKSNRSEAHHNASTLVTTGSPAGGLVHRGYLVAWVRIDLERLSDGHFVETVVQLVQNPLLEIGAPRHLFLTAGLVASPRADEKFFGVIRQRPRPTAEKRGLRSHPDGEHLALRTADDIRYPP